MQPSRPQAERSTGRCHAYQFSFDQLKAKAGVGQPQQIIGRPAHRLCRSRSSAVQRTGSAHVAIVDDVMLPSFDITHTAVNIIVQRATNRQGEQASPPIGTCHVQDH